MRLAFVHCRLYPGGALEVFKDLIQQELTSHPDAEMKVFTMIADKDLQQLTLPLP
ncbi:MAG: hypothetical protein LBG59_07225 [Candidatus Peribacteria bacterium]|jgi:hypothetical protein|nr:hypothetical protein [Candidatus Peribacteria bacterium]